MPPGLSRLRKIAAKVLRLPLFNKLMPFARKVNAVAEPPGWMHLHRPIIKPPHQECRPITILSANLWHDFPRHRDMLERLEAFSSLVESLDVDILLLQEVARTNWLLVDRWLAEKLDMTAVYTRANGHNTAIGFEEGLAVLSRFPLVNHHLRQLSTQCNPFVRRMALGVEILSPCGILLAFSVHLGLPSSQNARQIHRLRQWVNETAGVKTALVGGDFNVHETAPRIQPMRTSWLDTFRHLHPHSDGTTHTLRLPWGKLLKKHRLDYIFMRSGSTPWKVLETLHLQTAGILHSDHHAVLTRLEPAG